MKEDPTLQEIWDARQKIWEDCERDSEQLLAYYRQLQETHSHKLIRYEQIGSLKEEKV